MTNTKSRLRAIAAVFMSMILAMTMMLIPNEVSALGLSKKSFTLTKGYATTLKVTGSNSTVKWASSDTSVATVSSSGKVIGKGPGTATITATVDGTTLKATVKIVGGKLSVSNSDVTIAENSTEYITVRAKGSHALKANSDDKSVCTTGWVKPWKNNDIRLKLTARGTGTTTVRIYMTQFPDVYTTVKVTVGNGGSSNSSIVVNSEKVSVKAGDTASIYLSSKSTNLEYALSDKSVAAVSEGQWNGSTNTLTVRGLKAGTTRLDIIDKNNRSNKKSVTITVTGDAGTDGYYVVSESIPNKKTSTDQIYRYQVNNKYKYILVPAKYDEARINGAEAKDRNAYEYYKIYNVMPTKKASTDGVKEFSVIIGADGKISAANAQTVSTTTVSPASSGSFIDPNYVYYNNISTQPAASSTGSTEKRYILVPNSYDEPQVNTLIAKYTSNFDYWTVYNQAPTKKLGTDIVDSWTATVNYKEVTRYILLPQIYDQNKLQEIKNKDMGTSLGGYYAVTAYTPTKKASTDQIITFTTGGTVNNNNTTYNNGVPSIDFNTGNVTYNNGTINNNNYNYNGGQTLYILVPQNYDEARVNDAKAKYIGYEYNKVYATYPTKQVSSDVVESWTKIVDGKSVTRYALYPVGYPSTYLDSLKNKDLQNSSSAYYAVSASQPVQIASTDISKSWWNPKTNQMRYMIVPYNYDVTRYNDAVAADTGDFLYYHTYTKSPTYKQPNDSVQSAVIGGKTVYMLIPANYDQNKINMGFSGQEVNA